MLGEDDNARGRGWLGGGMGSNKRNDVLMPLV